MILAGNIDDILANNSTLMGPGKHVLITMMEEIT
jgi:hypothetical protein